MNTTLNKTTTKKVTTNELIDVLMNTTKSTAANITYVVDESKSKTVKGCKQLQKRVNITHIFLNHDYTNKVKNLTNNEDFVAQPLKGKTRISSTILQSDKSGKFLLDAKVLKSECAKVLTYIHNDEELTEAQAIAKELFAPSYFKPKSETTTSGRGTVSVEDDFRIINTTISKIEKLKMNGITYEVM